MSQIAPRVIIEFECLSFIGRERKGRMMVIVCHNTDNGDSWEREDESDYL